MRKRYFLQLLMFLLVIAAWVGGCNSKRPDDDEGQGSAAPALVSVKTAPVRKGDIDLVRSATGRTEALKAVKIFAPIAGTVSSLNVLEGMPVKQGDLLATIQTRESHAAIAGAEKLVQAARTPDERDEAVRALRLAEESQNKVNVYAPFSGIVAARDVTEGEIVAENTEMLTYLDPSTIVFVADVPLRDVPSLKVGQRCFVLFPGFPGKQFGALIDAINAQSDVQTKTVRSRLRFVGLNNDGLKTDMLGMAHIITGTRKGVLIVPKAALLRNDETETYSVVIVTSDSLARNVAVKVGAATDSTVEVKADALKEGMWVVVEGNYALADSTKVSAAENR